MLRGLLVAAAALLALTGCATEDDATTLTTAEPLTDAALLTADEVPARDRLTAWRDADPASEAALACQSGPLDALGAETVARRRFVANIAQAPEGDPSASVDLALLQYADVAAAETARQTVADQIEVCSPTLDDIGEAKLVPDSREVLAGDGRVVWMQRDFLASDLCTDCDAVRFHRMGVGVVGSRLLLVSLAEVGGPLQPEGLDSTMEALTIAALGRAGA
ncbi:hypothetical protein [Nocardioides sp. InS609-2]|uniref:hypothetical protein n=1 Tax=Nocardioides sp. InS609-2 TaxID=2760705 RepID=UPI0020C003B7|nr:hypothetical protein [Nocardioides sp. InS609-2]